MSGSGVTYNGDAEAALIARVAEWVKEAIKRQREGVLVFDPNCLDLNKVTAEVCGVSATTVQSSLRRGKRQGEKRKRGREKVILDHFQEGALTRLVLSFYKKSPPVLPTLKLVYEEALKMDGFPQVSIETLRKFLLKLEFRFSKLDKKRHVFQRKDVALQRHKYLQKISEYRANEFLIHYQDETWVNAYHVKQQCWQYRGKEIRLKELTGSTDEQALDRGGIKVGEGKGKRMIVNHIGSSNGFVDGAKDVFEATKKINYHDEMNADHWEEWLKDKVLPNIAAKSSKAVIVVDNATYHWRLTDESRTVTTANRKQEIRDWLTNKGIPWEVKDTKPVLLTKVKTIYIEKKYVIEEIAKEFSDANGVDIRILRLPVGHCDLNPIELIWADVKNKIARENTNPNWTRMKGHLETALDSITAERWNKKINHILKVEDDWRRRDGCGLGKKVDPCVVELADEDTDSDDSDGEDNGSSSWESQAHLIQLKAPRKNLGCII